MNPPSNRLASIVIISKNESGLELTLSALETMTTDLNFEVLVVDASGGTLSSIRTGHPAVRWIDFQGPADRTVTIPHQRNVGVAEAKGDIIMFVDAGCVPQEGWADKLLAPILQEGETFAAGPVAYDGSPYVQRTRGPYVTECPTINAAFEKSLWTELGGFDERFDYGSDTDFSWRAVSHGVRIRWVDGAYVSHDWGDWRRQVRRSYVYGTAKTRLYLKHPQRWTHLFTSDPGALSYALILLGLPIGLKYRWYFLILGVFFWRNRQSESPPLAVLNGFVLSIGSLSELVRVARNAKRGGHDTPEDWAAQATEELNPAVTA